MKRILVAHYSQTGQLGRLVDAVCAPLAADPGIKLSRHALEPLRPYPFPWPLLRFFDEFPESVWLDPPALRPLAEEDGGGYDLVILAYTVWFLSPCPPVTAFLKSEAGRRVLADTPVVTLIGCRNMWLLAQEEVKKLLAAVGARHCDNIVLTDSVPSLGSFVTTPRWMLTGRADGVFGLPRPGIYPEDIAAAARFGRAMRDALNAGAEPGQPMLRGLRAAVVDDRLIASERVGRRSFLAWGALIRMLGPQGSWLRKPVLCVYICFLVAMILTVVPLTLALRALLRPLAARRLERLRQYYEQPSGSGTERMAQFAESAP